MPASEQHIAMSYLIPLYLDHLRSTGARRSTVEIRGIILNRVHESLPFGLAYAATEQLEAWLGNPEWGRWTRRTYKGHVQAFYRWATRAGHLDGDPSVDLVKIRQPKLVPRPVTEEELAAALTVDDPLFVGVVLAAFAGERCHEIAHQRREDITEERVFIPDGKGGEPGSVPTHPFLWEVVKDRPRGLLVTDNGEPIDGHWVSVLGRNTFLRMGLTNVRMHRLRHRFGTKIQQEYGDIRVTQECLRHASITSTQGYTLVTGQQRTAAVEGLPVPEVKKPEPDADRLGSPTTEAA